MSVAIGCFSGFWGDSMWAAAQLVHGETRLDFLVGDYLAEVTMGILAKSRDKAAGGAGKGGFVQEFVDRVWSPLGGTLMEKGTRVVTNAGGMNPLGLKEAVEKVAAAKGWKVRVAAVFGDDVTARMEELSSRLLPFPGEEELPGGRSGASSANVYFGARGIAAALRAGANVVVTGRVVDSALVLGPLVASFGWGWDQWTLLARGSVVGHILECGCQTTGGNYTDWRETPSWVNVGFPVAHCSSDGSAVITKNPGTGGLVTVKSVTEQLLYEIGDPRCYVLPDVVVDFTTVTVSQEDPDRVRISGATGRPATPHYKVCLTRPMGYVVSALLLVPGSECRDKAAAVAVAVLDNANAALARLGMQPIEQFHHDVIGGHRAEGYDECVLRMVFAHSQLKALQIAGLEVAPAALAMAPGLCGVGQTGRTAPSRRMAHYSLLLPKTALAASHTVAIASEDPFAVDDLAHIQPLAVLPPPPSSSAPLRHAAGAVVPLWRAAYGRSGDKGDAANIGVVARSPQLFCELQGQVTAEAVTRHLQSLGLAPARVDRHELPLLGAFNFVVHGVLGGGGGSSLLLDKQGKTFAQKLLAMQVAVSSLPAKL